MTALSVLSTISKFSATLTTLTFIFVRSLNGVYYPKPGKKKTLASLGDGDFYHGKKK